MTGIGPGTPGDPFGAPPVVADGFVEVRTSERLTVSDDDGEPTTLHAFGWGRAGCGVEVVELHTDLGSVRVPVVATGGYCVIVAAGSDPALVAHATPEDDQTAAE